MGREIDGNPNHDISAISPRQRREERQRERRENLARFQRARKAKEQLHLNKSRRIRQGRDRSPNMSSSNEFKFDSAHSIVPIPYPLYILIYHPCTHHTPL